MVGGFLRITGDEVTWTPRARYKEALRTVIPHSYHLVNSAF